MRYCLLFIQVSGDNHLETEEKSYISQCNNDMHGVIIPILRPPYSCFVREHSTRASETVLKLIASFHQKRVLNKQLRETK